MPDLDWNKSTWDGSYDWSRLGDEWSAPWESSAAMFFTTILPRIGAALPAQRILEIAPGHGRCTQFLLRFCDYYHGIDLSDRCVEFCRERFASSRRARFDTNNGKSLDAVGNTQFDLIFSFDSLVHADADAMDPYIPQIVRALAPGGVAFIHHSNMGAHPDKPHPHRSMNVSASTIASAVRSGGGAVIVQEIFGNAAHPELDCFTMFCRAGSTRRADGVVLTNTGLIGAEAKIARASIAHYCGTAAVAEAPVDPPPATAAC